MSIQTTQIKVSGTSVTHETITDYNFKDSDNTETGWKTKKQASTMSISTPTASGSMGRQSQRGL